MMFSTIIIFTYRTSPADRYMYLGTNARTPNEVVAQNLQHRQTDHSKLNWAVAPFSHVGVSSLANSLSLLVVDVVKDFQ